MSRRPTIKAGYDGHSAKIELTLPVISFKDENNVFIAHIPALDLTGYGNTEEEAKVSLGIVMDEYFDYAVKNHTLHQDLKKHGWKINDEIETPPLSDLIAIDPLKDVINNTKFTSDYKKIELPAYC